MAIKILLIGAAIFIGTHLIPALGQARTLFVNRLSLNGYKLLFTVFSLVGLGLMIWGKSRAPFISVWSPPPWGRDAAMVIMFPSILLLSVAKLPTNIKRFTPHPMLWGVILWSVAHLLANGDVASMIIFEAIGIYSIIAIISANQRGAKLSTQKVSVGRETAGLIFGVIVYIALLYLHPYLFGPKLI
ncbi:MAG: NnrU family protein [Acidiferrobacterales bacterium]|nr:NnrU family protein [Acidiferrobacterales bacterium]